jgi:acetyl esterase/lipase
VRCQRAMLAWVVIYLVIAVSESTAQGTFTSIRDIAYAGDELNSHKLDLHIPNGVAGPLPVVIWIHGGGWQSGDKALNPNSFQLRYARNGYVVASLNYRLSAEAVYPAQIHDCKAAIRWLRANAAQYNLDTTRFGVWGSSAGGHLAALLGTTGDVADLEGTVGGNTQYSSRVQAVVDWYGPTDFLQMDSQALAQGCAASNHNSATSAESLLIGCPIQTCPDAVQRANPLTFLTPDDPPFFIQHGTADCVVPMGQSQILQTVLQDQDHDSAFITLAGAGHGGPLFSTESNLVQVDSFLQTRLREFTPQPATISGRVTTPSGQILRNAKVIISSSSGSAIAAVTTGSFGYFQFEGITPGNMYTIAASSKRYRFAPRVLQVLSDLSSIDLVGLE